MPTTTPPPPVNPFKKSSATSKKALTLGIIALILSIAAAAFAAVTWGQFSRINDHVNRSSTQQGQSVKLIKTKMQDLQQQLTTVQGGLAHLVQITTNVSTQRALAEASYLIHLANLHLTIGHDATAALQLLQIASQRLRPVSAPIVFALKHALLHDITALKAAPKVDVANLVLKLDQVSQAVQGLPGLPSRTVPKQIQTTPIVRPNDENLPWYKKMAGSLSGLKDFVVIRHIKKPTMPLLSPEQLTFLRENVQLKIAQAEWAVLHQKPMLYKKSLTLASTWLKNYYQDQTAAADILQDLQQLAAINIKPKQPSMTKVLNALNQSLVTFPQAPPKSKNKTDKPAKKAEDAS